MPKAVTKPAPPTHDINDKVLCFHGPLLYEAKVLQIKTEDASKPPTYKVHYKGWKSSWDEWVPQDRVLKWSDENLKTQKRLKEEHAPPKKKMEKKKETRAPSEEAIAPPIRGQKRAREMDMDKEEDFIKRHEIKLTIPENIKSRLVDDWEYVTKNGQLVHLPREPNVVQVLEKYKAAVAPRRPQSQNAHDKDIIDEVVAGLIVYFNKCLGTILLYRFEREQYTEIKKKFADKEMSEIYGVEHLARLFVSMPELIAHTNMDQQSVNVLREHLESIMGFIAEHQYDLFLEEYDAAPSAYNTKSS